MLRCFLPLMLACAAAPAAAQPPMLNPQIDYDGYRALIDGGPALSPGSADRLGRVHRRRRRARRADPRRALGRAVRRRPYQGRRQRAASRVQRRAPRRGDRPRGPPDPDLLQQQFPQRSPAGHAENRAARAQPFDLHPPLRLRLPQRARAQRRDGFRRPAGALGHELSAGLSQSGTIAPPRSSIRRCSTARPSVGIVDSGARAGRVGGDDDEAAVDLAAASSSARYSPGRHSSPCRS